MKDEEATGTSRAPGNGIQVVERAMDVLEWVSHHGPSSVQEIASGVGLNRTTVHRIVRTLSGRRWLVREAARPDYVVGPRLLSLLQDALADWGLPQRAYPLLERYRNAFEETAQAASLDGNEIVHFAGVSAQTQRGIALQIGQRAQLWNTALGKAILFSLPEKQFAAILEPLSRRPELPGLAKRLRREKEQFEANGFAIDDEESSDGVRCVAVSLRPLGLENSAASVTAPATRLTSELARDTGARMVEMLKAQVEQEEKRSRSD